MISAHHLALSVGPIIYEVILFFFKGPILLFNLLLKHGLPFEFSHLLNDGFGLHLVKIDLMEVGVLQQDIPHLLPSLFSPLVGYLYLRFLFYNHRLGLVVIMINMTRQDMMVKSYFVLLVIRVLPLGRRRLPFVESER